MTGWVSYAPKPDCDHVLGLVDGEVMLCARCRGVMGDIAEMTRRGILPDVTDSAQNEG